MGSGWRPYGAPRGLRWEVKLYNVMAGGTIKKALIVESRHLVSMYANIWMYAGEQLKREKNQEDSCTKGQREKSRNHRSRTGHNGTNTHSPWDRCFRHQKTKAVIVERKPDSKVTCFWDSGRLYSPLSIHLQELLGPTGGFTFDKYMIKISKNSSDWNTIGKMTRGYP